MILKTGKELPMKVFRSMLSVLLALCLVLMLAPASVAETSPQPSNQRGVNNTVIIDTDPAGGYEGDYVVIYNPSTSASASYSTGNMEH